MASSQIKAEQKALDDSDASLIAWHMDSWCCPRNRNLGEGYVMRDQLHIDSIRIRNFRSIRDLTISPGDLSIFVGQNDVGKSNIMRALNLFFNFKDMYGSEFDFDTEHNVFNNPTKRAKEISIKITIQLPKTYRDTNGSHITWEKRWRSSGEVYNEYFRLDREPISAKSKVHALLRRINYVYVPAIKDPEYFAKLQAMIYRTLSSIAGEKLRESSGEFENSISNEISDLISEISDTLDIKSRLALPKDLSGVFSNLEFLDEGHGLSLNSRGDGVKVRHIPLILNFIARVMQKSPSVQNAVPYNIIWGYEEPENSLEFSSCINLADKFVEFLNNGDICQIILTTHSPVFYNLLDQKVKIRDGGKITCDYVFQKDDKFQSTATSQRYDNLDERMGVTADFGKAVVSFENTVRQKNPTPLSVVQLGDKGIRVLYVEGKSDRIFYQKVFDTFSEKPQGKILVRTSSGGRSGGADYVINMLQSWQSYAKHEAKGIRVAGLLDQDAKDKKRTWNSGRDHIDFAKCFCLPVPPHIVPIIKAEFKVSVDLETLYGLAYWEKAKKYNYLVERTNDDNILPNNIARKIKTERITLEDILKREPELSLDWLTILLYKFDSFKKTTMARRMIDMSDEEFKREFRYLDSTVKDISGYLFRCSKGTKSK